MDRGTGPEEIATLPDLGLLLQAQAVARVVRGEQERYGGYTPL